MRPHDPNVANPRTCGLALTVLPVDLLAKVLAPLPVRQQAELAPTCRALATAVRLNTRGIAVDLRLRSREGVCSASLTPAVTFPQLDTLALISPAAASASATAAAAATQARQCCDTEEAPRLWIEASGSRRLRWRPALAAWPLRRAAAALGNRSGRHLTLLVVAPEMDCSTSELHRMMQTAGAEGLFTAVQVPQGLLRLDGSLNAHLTAANAVASGLPTALQACTPYSRLARLALKLSPADDLPPILACINPSTLPALRCLALLAPSGAGAAADMAALRHPGLTRLDLRNVQLPAGFPSLQHLTGLHALGVRYEEEEEAPPLNLQGDLSSLSALRQLSALSLDSLGSSEGLPALSRLTSLSLCPQQGARITLQGLPLLRRLALDLSAGSCGRDLLSAERSTVHVPPTAHGLASLLHLELRCFVWRHWEAGGSEADGSDGAGSDANSGSEASSGSDGHGVDAGGSEASSNWSSVAGSEAASSLAGSGSGMEEAGSEGGWADVEEEEEEAEGEEEEEAASSAASEGGDGAEEAAEQEIGEEEGEEEGEEGGGEEAEGGGLLDATWGFLQAGSSGRGGDEQAHAMASLEHRYLAALLARLPSLATIQLTDYMGLVDPSSLLLAAAPQAPQPAKPTGPPLGAAAAAAAVAHAAKGAGAGASSAAGLLLQGAAAGAAVSSLPGWQRTVAETPVPGGISQYDVTYSLAGGGV